MANRVKEESSIVKLSELEMERFAARTPKSKAALENGRKYIPLGVSSNFRFYPPHPIFVKSAKGGRFWDLDGNEYGPEARRLIAIAWK